MVAAPRTVADTKTTSQMATPSSKDPASGVRVTAIAAKSKPETSRPGPQVSRGSFDRQTMTVWTVNASKRRAWSPSNQLAALVSMARTE